MTKERFQSLPSFPSQEKTRRRVEILLMPVALMLPALGCSAPSYCARVKISRESEVASNLKMLADKAKRGDEGSRLALANLYEEGNGVPRDLKMAKVLYNQIIRSANPNIAGPSICQERVFSKYSRYEGCIITSSNIENAFYRFIYLSRSKLCKGEEFSIDPSQFNSFLIKYKNSEIYILNANKIYLNELLTKAPVVFYQKNDLFPKLYYRFNRRSGESALIARLPLEWQCKFGQKFQLIERI